MSLRTAIWKKTDLYYQELSGQNGKQTRTRQRVNTKRESSCAPSLIGSKSPFKSSSHGLIPNTRPAKADLVVLFNVVLFAQSLLG